MPELQKVAALLTKLYGEPRPPRVRDPYEMALHENVAYLVDDSVRDEVFAELARRIGLSPPSIRSAPIGLLAEVIRKGGMRPEDRAAKLVTCAEIAEEVGLPELRRLVRESPKDARRILKRFPGIGEPGADRILLVAGGHPSLAPDSNALRVLVRLGFAAEGKSYDQTYRAACAAVREEIGRDADRIVALRERLRTHGQTLCRRTSPRCAVCPLAALCPYPST